MKPFALAVVFAACASSAAAQTLTLKDAIEQGLAHNRNVANATLQVEKAGYDVADARVKRLPSFSIDAQASQLLQPVDVNFPRGAFGAFPGIGPIPSTDTSLTTPAKLTFLFNAKASQPLTPLFKINLNVHLTEAAHAMDRERLRDSQLTLADEIRRVYFAIAQSRTAIDASDHTLALLDEIDRAVTGRLVQQVALKVDSLNVRSRIAQAQLDRLSLEQTLASQKEQLNNLMGRDIRTPFEVVDLPEAAFEEIRLDAAQARALASRPDVREAHLKLQQAEIARRMATTDYLPDARLVASYTSPINIDGAPRQIATAALQVQWEPFDWGRKGRAAVKRDLDIRQAKNGVQETEARALIEVNSQFRRLERARAQLRAVGAGQDAAREQARIRVTQYSAQAALLSDVLQAESTLADVDHQYEQALAGFWTARADFERAIGEEGQ
jgi:outer membrane protein TolC